MHTPTGCVHSHIDITKSEDLGENSLIGTKSQVTSICIIFGAHKPYITRKLANASNPQTVSSTTYCSYLHLFTHCRLSEILKQLLSNGVRKRGSCARGQTPLRH